MCWNLSIALRTPHTRTNDLFIFVSVTIFISSFTSSPPRPNTSWSHCSPEWGSRLALAPYFSVVRSPMIYQIKGSRLFSWFVYDRDSGS